MTATTATTTEWQALLERARTRGVLDAATLRGALLAAGPTRAEVDEGLAKAWRSGDEGLRVHGLRDALDGLVPGAALVDALLETVEDPDPKADGSANAALRILREAAGDPLDSEGWRRVARVARRQRTRTIPDRDAALLLAERGPEEAWPTLVLVAFRDGPEDAGDRLAALTALGRTGGVAAAPLLAEVIDSGAAALEALQALAEVAAIAHASGDEAGLERVLGALFSAASVERAEASGDGWSRWVALDLLSRLVGEAALPLLHGARLAGGQDDLEWYLPQVRARIDSLGGGKAEPTTLPPLPDLRRRVLSRCPRVARRAAQQASERADLADVLAERARIEAALVDRGQLMASFLPTDGVEPAALDASWDPWSQRLDDDAREALSEVETGWLGRL